jgi:hypothetical protein
VQGLVSLQEEDHLTDPQMEADGRNLDRWLLPEEELRWILPCSLLKECGSVNNLASDFHNEEL